MKKEEGITLVALIITIIVLIILAAVTLQTLVVDGVINLASQGSINYSQAQSNEVSMLNEMSGKLDDTIKQIQKVGGKVGTLTVELSVQEAEVTSTEIPIKVESVKKKDGTTVENGLTYEYKCEVLDTEEIIEKSKDEYEMFTKTVDIDSLGTTEAVKVKKQDETEYTFKELDKETCYKITVTVTDGEGNTGTESVGILGFKISDGGTGLGDNFYRATLGSDVKSWASSKYSVKVYDGLNLIVRAYGLVVDDGANWVRIGNDEAAFEFYGVVCLLDRATFSEEEK